MAKSYTEQLELLKFSSVLVESTFTKRYHNSLLLMMKLSRSERIFLDYITEEMDDDNFITNSPQVRLKFNALLSKNPIVLPMASMVGLFKFAGTFLVPSFLNPILEL